MPDEVTDAPAGEGSTPDDGGAAPDEPTEGSTPAEGEGDGADEKDDEAGDDAGDSDEDSDDDDDSDSDDEDSDDEDEADSEDEQDAARATKEWRNLDRKFAHIHDKEKREAAIGKAYWGKARYAKQQRERAEAAERRVAELENERRAPEPEEPHPDVVEAEARVTRIEAKRDRIDARRKEAVDEVNEADRQLAVAKSKLEDISDDDKETLRVAKARIAEKEKDLKSATRRYNDILEQRAEALESLDDARKAVAWAKTFQQGEKARQREAEKGRERFERDFNLETDRLALQAARELGLNVDKDQKLRKMLLKQIGAPLIVQLERMPDGTTTGDVDYQAMVGRVVKDFARTHDLVRRKDFRTVSERKLAVTSRTPQGGKAPTTAATPASARAPVPVSLMGSDSQSLMAKARATLVNRFDRRRA